MNATSGARQRGGEREREKKLRERCARTYNHRSSLSTIERDCERRTVIRPFDLSINFSIYDAAHLTTGDPLSRLVFHVSLSFSLSTSSRGKIQSSLREEMEIFTLIGQFTIQRDCNVDSSRQSMKPIRCLMSSFSYFFFFRRLPLTEKTTRIKTTKQRSFHVSNVIKDNM